MPNREFLETYPLYRKFRTELATIVSGLGAPAIHMECSVCGSGQTFGMTNEYHDAFEFTNHSTAHSVIRVVYTCASCKEFPRYFLLKFGPEAEWVMKVGQEPPWDISVDRTLAKVLGARVDYYKSGLICESQGYGIGAFSYYRRIVEEIIDELLVEIADLLADEEQEHYREALEQVKNTTITRDKIDLVKDLLPPIMRPDGMNPLSVLHGTLSQGLHRESDERCLTLAMEVREVLEFLVNQVRVSKEARRTFTASMRKLLGGRNQ